MPSWDQNFNPDSITRRMEKTKFINKDGNLSFKNYDFYEDIQVLSGMLSLSGELTEKERKNILSKAIFLTGIKKEITPQSLLPQLGKLENAHLSKPQQNYYLHTNISIASYHSLPRVIIDGSHITFRSQRPKVVQEARDTLNPEIKRFFTNDLPKRYMTVSVKVQHRTIEAAVDKALDQLDCIRGIWNLYQNRKTLTFHSGLPKPVNKMLLGPIHTLHKNNGGLATDLWWYEPEYPGPVQPYGTSKIDVSGMYNFTRSVRKLLKASLYKNELIEAILRYVRALDFKNKSQSYLHLWSLLEHLTSTLQASYKVTIKRASFLFEDDMYHTQVLLHLKNIRNGLVHKGLAQDENISEMINRLKFYVEFALEFHLGNRGKFISLEEAGKFLDLNPNAKWLDMEMKRLRRAKIFIQPKK